MVLMYETKSNVCNVNCSFFCHLKVGERRKDAGRCWCYTVEDNMLVCVLCGDDAFVQL